MDTVLKNLPYDVQAKEVDGVPGFLQTIQCVLTAEECQAIIDITEAKGFVAASIYTDSKGREHFSDTRKSSRCIVDSPEFVARLWTRIQHCVPKTWGTAQCVGLNERLRILRYDPGDEFKPHSDGSYTAPSGAISKITVLIYLNAGYEGGYTHFLHEDARHFTEREFPSPVKCLASSQDGRAWIAIEPYVGSVAMQDQTLVHGVPPLLKGRKYAMRTEVMYIPPMQAGPTKEFTITY
jgi:hypothetical protein